MERKHTPTGKLTIKDKPIDDLSPSPYNPRKWDAKQKADLKKSIERFGLVDPILVNCALGRENVVIGGHFRLEVAKELGFKTVPTVSLNIPDLEKEKELNMRLNLNQGEFDWDLVMKHFDIPELLDFGIDEASLTAILDSTAMTEEDDFDQEQELLEMKNPKSKEGDLYQLGSHRLLCGNSQKLEDVQRLVGKERVQMIYCDPPYNLNIDYNAGIGGKQRYGGDVDDNLSDEDYTNFLRKTMENALRVAADDVHCFYYCDETYIGLVQQLYRELGITNKRVCLWVKNVANVTPKIAFNKVYEPAIYGVRGKPYLSGTNKNLTEILNREISTGNRLPDDILDLLSIWLVDRIPSSEYQHSTQKPTTLHEKPLRRCTRPNDIVLDLFGGSGSTLISCEQMNRRAYLMEKTPIFCDLIINRYEQLTSTKAKRIR